MPGLERVNGIPVTQRDYEAERRAARQAKLSRELSVLASLLMDKIAEAQAAGMESYRDMADGGERECMRDLYGTMYGFGHGQV